MYMHDIAIDIVKTYKATFYSYYKAYNALGWLIISCNTYITSI